MKRLVIIFAVSLLFGAVVNVAIAWTCACRSEAMPGTYSVDYGDEEPLTWPRPMPPAWPVPNCMWRSHSFGLSNVYIQGEGEMPTWHEEPDSNGELRRDNPTYYALDLFTAGWPLRSLKWEVRNVAENPSGQIYGFVTGPLDMWNNGLPIPRPSLLSLPVTRPSHRRLPLKPLPIGFIVNSAVFAAIPWAVIAPPLRMARFLRLRAGLCPRCKYPIGGSPLCTECGAQLPPRNFPA